MSENIVSKNQTQSKGVNIFGEGPSQNFKSNSCQLLSSDTTVPSDTDVVSIPMNESLNQTLQPNISKNHSSKKKVLELSHLEPIRDDGILKILDYYKDTIISRPSSSQLDHIQWTLEQMATSLVLNKNKIKRMHNSLISLQSLFPNESIEVIESKIEDKQSSESPFIHKFYKSISDSEDEKSPSSTMEEKTENKFWSSVDMYMSSITKEDIDWLENRIQSYDQLDYLSEIPPIGVHYSKIWAEKELKMNYHQPSCSTTPTADQPSCSTTEKPPLSERVMPDVVELLHKINHTVLKGSVYSPVYQRVTAALLEHLNISADDSDNSCPENGVSDSPEIDYATQTFYTQQNIEKQLFNLGLLNVNNEMLPSSYVESDEILREIENCDLALAELKKQNKKDLTTILEKCRIDYDQQNIRAKLKELDNKILNYKRSPNGHLTNEERSAQVDKETCYMQSLLNQRSNYLMELKSINKINKPTLESESELNSESEEITT